MSFSSMSVKEAIDNINATSNGWFLPAIQRPYVWGSRYESEKYICRLFDSILSGYPIGTLIVWNSESEIPYRQFIEDYSDGETAQFVDKSLWRREDKWLVYDGQQRLQTLFSCLKYTLNSKILTYNLFYSLDDSDDTETTGFKFIGKHTDLEPGYISMPQLFIQTEGQKGDGKVKYRGEIKKTIPSELMEGHEGEFETIIDKLWDVFVRKDIKSLAYFPIDKSWSEDRVNDVFQRLNMGGVPLSGADLLLSRIKEKSYDYEEKLQLESKQLYAITQGYVFEPSAILQLIHLIIKGNPRIEPARIKETELLQFISVFDALKAPLNNFFKGFIYDTFLINNKSIVGRGAALMPLIAYVYARHIRGTVFAKIENENLLRMKQFFILSQLNDWNTQTIVSKCTELALSTDVNFPLEDIKTFVGKNNRLVDLTVSSIEEYVWFPLKVLIPKRSFISAGVVQGRYKPELDHIFPMKLVGRPDDYEVNVLWNMQPVTGVVNASKGNTHPQTFFSIETNQKYMSQYDYVPTDLNSTLWDDHKAFIEHRKKLMIGFMKSEYGLEIKEATE